MLDNPIGRKVHRLIETRPYNFDLDREHTYEIVRVLDDDEVKNDWCRHFIIKDAVVEMEVREVECVFTPDTTKNEVDMLYHYLSDNGVYAEVYHFSSEVPAIVVSIHLGDWKHEHLWSNDLMGYLGYREIGCQVTDDTQSDCYSADHYYLKTE